MMIVAKSVLLATSVAAVLGIGAAAGKVYNQTFTPWTVMGPVNTAAKGFAVLNYTGSLYTYDVYLFNILGVSSIELHVATPGTHGEVVAVLYAAAFANDSQILNGLVAKGQIQHTDFVGPLLLPLGQHLEPSVLQTLYVEKGNAIFVVHTLRNPGGELGAQILPGAATTTCQAMPMSAMGPMSAQTPSMSQMAPAHSG